MNWDKYADKKAKSLVAFEKETVTIKEAVKEEKDEFDVVIVKGEDAVTQDKIVLKEKQYSAETGVAMDDNKTEYTKEQLEAIKTGYEAEATKNTDLAKAVETAMEDFDKVK